MSTLNNEWRQYRDAVYPNGTHAQQNRECHQAFFAGALSGLLLMDALSRLPEDEAILELRKLNDEAMSACGAIADALKARN